MFLQPGHPFRISNPHGSLQLWAPVGPQLVFKKREKERLTIEKHNRWIFGCWINVGFDPPESARA